jgi:hypothetical protein
MKSNIKPLHLIIVAAFVCAVQVANAFYDPSLQRWLDRDPIGGLGGINLFAMVGNNTVDGVDAFGKSKFNRSSPVTQQNCAPASVAGQWHHPVSPSNNTYQFYNHPLVQGAGWSKADLQNKQPTTYLENHSGPHCESYHDQIEKRLDLAHESINNSTDPVKCDQALRGVFDKANSDIANGTLRPYENKTVSPVPGYEPTPYGRVRACGARLNGILPFLDIFNMMQMLFRPTYEYHHSDGTIRDEKGNVIGYWMASAHPEAEKTDPRVLIETRNVKAYAGCLVVCKGLDEN